MTHQGDLDSFWRTPEAPSADLYEAFRRVVMARTQVNGAFATRRGRALAAPAVVERLIGRRGGCGVAEEATSPLGANPEEIVFAVALEA
jgi:hypothetical protein